MSKPKMSRNQNKRTEPGPSGLNKTTTTPCNNCKQDNNSATDKAVAFLQLTAAFILAVGLMGGAVGLVANLWNML